MHIDTDAAVHNLLRIRELAPKSKIVAVVKANAYGHGAERIAKALCDEASDHVAMLGVVSLDEAMVLREARIDKPCLLMQGFYCEDELKKLGSCNCQPIIHNEFQLAVLEKVRLPNPINVWLKINTGLNRLGFPAEDASDAYFRLKKSKNVIFPPTLATHFADPDQDKAGTMQQMEIFSDLTADLEGPRSLANSGAILNFPQSHGDFIRPGITIYGVSPLAGHVGSDHGIKPVMKLEAELIDIRNCHKGDRVGYGGIWQCPENMPIGTVSIGYADGYPRIVENGTPVLVGDVLCNTAGRVSMDMLAIDLRNHPAAKIGDTVILWGAPEVPVEKVAVCAKTTAYELLCKVTQRVDGYEY